MTIKATTSLRFEELSDKKDGRIWVDCTVDGSLHSYVHVSGPKDDVLDYFAEKITLVQLRSRWHIPASV